MINRYVKTLTMPGGGTPPPTPTYNPVCITMATETVGTQAFFKATAIYTTSQDTTVTIQVNTAFNSGVEAKSYTVTRVIPNSGNVSGNSKLTYTSGYPDEHFTGISSIGFSPAVDGGGRTFTNNGICG